MADTFALTWDDSQLVKRFSRTEKQMVFGVVNALNQAAKTVQQAEFAHLRSDPRFTIRKPQFFFGTEARPGGVAARITAFASVPRDRVPAGRLFAELSLAASSQSSQRRTLLPLFEQGGTRAPFTQGAKSVAVPITGGPARPTFASPVPQPFTFAGLAFRAYRRGEKLKVRRRSRNAPLTIFGEFGRLSREKLALRGLQWKGKQRTFILFHSIKAPFGGVFQRIGPGRDQIRLVYEFVHPFQLPADLGWLQTAREIAPGALHDAIEDQLVDIVVHNAGRAE